MLEKKGGYRGNDGADGIPPNGSLPKLRVRTCAIVSRFFRVTMKVLHCAGVTGSCDFVTKGDSEQEILQPAPAHAQSAHNIQDRTAELAEKAA